jgi:hypothetical protein
MAWLGRLSSVKLKHNKQWKWEEKKEEKEKEEEGWIIKHKFCGSEIEKVGINHQNR